MDTQETLVAKRKLAPTPGGSTYITPAELPWLPTRFDKVSIKVLYEDKAKGEMTCLVKLEPGAFIPFHMHPELEQAFVLEGSMHDHRRRIRRVPTGSPVLLRRRFAVL